MKRSNQHRAFMLIEMLVVLGLLGAFALIATRLLGASMKTLQECPLAQDAITRFDGMSSTLRDDVWTAKSVELIDPRTLSLRNADDLEIRWVISEDATMVRKTGSTPPEEQRWINVGTDLRFDPGNGSLALMVRDNRIILPNLRERVNR